MQLQAVVGKRKWLKRDTKATEKNIQIKKDNG